MTESSHYLRTWRPAPELPRAGGRSSRRLRVALLAASVLALSGALIAWLTYVSPFPKAHFLPLCLDEYGDDFPVRPWGRQDADALRGLPWHENNAFTVQKRDLLSQELRDFTQRERDGPLVIYLSGYARAKGNDELCVLPVDARLDQPDTWLPLRDVFKYLHDSKARHKLLLLDIMQPFTDARRGALANDAAERLQSLLDEVLPTDPYLSVLCACSPGQVSIVAEELGHSVFAYFLWDGLRGQADGENARRHRDDRVSVKELAGYVTTQVEKWTLRHRNVRQTPRLQGAADDYPLVAVDSSKTPVEESPLEADYPQWLSAGWKRRDSWWDDESYRLVPETFRQLEAALMRAEQQWRGGVGVERVRQGLAARRDRLERQRNARVHVAELATADSLAKATDSGRHPPQPADEETVLAMRRLALRHARAKAGKPGEEEQKKLAADTEQQLKKLAGKPLALAWVVFAAADAESSTPASLRFLAGLLAKERVPDYAETRLLGRLAELPAAEEWLGESIRLALRTRWEAEKTAAGDADALVWVREARDRADRLRREGEALLFARDPAERRRAEGALRLALRAYRSVSGDLRTVEEARVYRDQMMGRLPSYAPSLEIDDSPEPAWENALATSRALRQALAAPLAPAGLGREGQIRQLAELTALLRNDPNNPNSLRRPLNRDHFDKLIGRSEVGDSADVKVMTALLETPWPRAEQRAALWTARHKLLEMLGRRRAERNVPARDEARALAAERQRALRRAHRSLELLKWEGAGPLDKVEMAFARFAEQPADAARMRILAEELRQAWAHRTNPAASVDKVTRSGERP